ncbi:NAD(P)-dependent oxidoreductase [Micromonospora sp. WMMD987]|uniref:NAD-dependent epimerase/dehydratase family protein n=1 Tax=Micromonospora TaxID=1873 RepID=UPI00249A5185|nr:NAD(P)-dependent oxidoreductase [Micromonospora sp. WMMD987]WFE95421.1 NAD(P)-dependent oxidoreductase [Micromonospora sp. WMMD987]
MSPDDGNNGCVAVLGGTGWVGRHVCDAFAARGYRVVALARGPVPGIRHDAFVRLDLATATPGTIAGILRAEQVDVVVNATDAANATDGWEHTEEQFARVNVEVVRHLLTAVAALPRPPRLVHLGTIHEYGTGEPGVAIDESVAPEPVSGYARTKLAGSRLVLDAARAGRVDGVVLRAVNVCGPYPSPVSLPGKLLRLLDEATRTGRMELGVAPDRRDFVDVRDLADATLRAAGRPGLRCAVNIGSGTAVDMRSFVTLFVTSAGYPASILVQRPATGSSLGGAWIEADIRRAGTLLGWAPRIPLGRSLREMWEAYRAG